MTEIKPKPFILVLLLVLALFAAGLVGYNFGSDNMNEKWVETSQKIVPFVIDYVIERCEKAPLIEMFAESNKELIKREGLLLFIEGTWMHIDPAGYLEYMKKVR